MHRFAVLCAAGGRDLTGLGQFFQPPHLAQTDAGRVLEVAQAALTAQRLERRCSRQIAGQRRLVHGVAEQHREVAGGVLRRAGEHFVRGQAPRGDARTGQAVAGHVEEGLAHVGAHLGLRLAPRHADMQRLFAALADDARVIVLRRMGADDRRGAATLFHRVEDGSLGGGQVGVLVDKLVGHVRGQPGGADQPANVGPALGFQSLGRLGFESFGHGRLLLMPQAGGRVRRVGSQGDFGDAPAGRGLDPARGRGVLGPARDAVADADSAHGPVRDPLQDRGSIFGGGQLQDGDNRAALQADGPDPPELMPDGTGVVRVENRHALRCAQVQGVGGQDFEERPPRIAALHRGRGRDHGGDGARLGVERVGPRRGGASPGIVKRHRATPWLR